MKTKWMNIRTIGTGMVLLAAGLISPVAQAQQKVNYRNFDEAKVIYRGLENNLRISVPHDPNVPIEVTCADCAAIAVDANNPEIYKVRAGTTKELTLQVKAKVGNVYREYEQLYRVSNLPPASVYLDEKPGGQELSADLTGILSMGYPQEVELSAQFTVLSWEMEVKGEKMQGLGAQLSEEALKTIASAGAGQNLGLLVRYKDSQNIQRTAVGVYKLKM